MKEEQEKKDEYMRKSDVIISALDVKVDKLEIKLDKIINILNPLDGKGGLILTVDKLKWQVGLLWGAFFTTLLYSLKKVIGINH